MWCCVGEKVSQRGGPLRSLERFIVRQRLKFGTQGTSRVSRNWGHLFDRQVWAVSNASARFNTYRIGRR